VHRGAHSLANKATEQYELAREQVRSFIGASSFEEVVFTGGATDSINLVAQSLSQLLALAEGDEVLLSVMEHHSNLVPWQLAAQRTKASLRFIPLTQVRPYRTVPYRTQP
jgi:cysteine desulfurase/selenocysteine lyase